MLLFVENKIFFNILTTHQQFQLEFQIFQNCLRSDLMNKETILTISTVTEFKEFERRFKFKPRFKYGWFPLKLYQMFQYLNRHLI